jgi:holo-[acyl-carrier protein] synthase
VIKGVGVDLIKVDRLEKAVQRSGERFLERVFCLEELEYCQTKKNPFPHLAVRFAAKEATFKALGTGWGLGLGWKEILINQNEVGQPQVYLKGKAQERAQKMGIKDILISLSHEGDYALAFAVAQD